MKKENEVKNVINKMGFTLIELLVVVLIIGILSAVALPGYRKAVEKSRVSDALTTMQAVAKSEHGWYLTNNSYTKDFSNLDIDLIDAEGNKADNASFANALYTYELLDTGVIADRNNGEYTIYKDYETNQIMCTPGSHYICEDLGAFTKVACEKANMVWANTNTTCYVNEETRCTDLYGENRWNEDTTNPENSFCGYVNTNGQELTEGMECHPTEGYKCQSIIKNGGICRGAKGITHGCSWSTIEEGGICLGNGTWNCGYAKINSGGTCIGNTSGGCGSPKYISGICIGNTQTSCQSTTVNDGGICVGNEIGKPTAGSTYPCSDLTVKDGGICYANGTGTCTGKYYDSACCCGKFCNSLTVTLDDVAGQPVPICAPEKCDSKYLK